MPVLVVSAIDPQPTETLLVPAVDAAVEQLEVPRPIVTPLPTPVAANTWGDISPAAINPSPIAVTRKALVEEIVDVVLIVAFELTLDFDDLPRALAYSETAIKQFKDAFHMTL